MLFLRKNVYIRASFIAFTIPQRCRWECKPGIKDDIIVVSLQVVLGNNRLLEKID